MVEPVRTTPIESNFPNEESLPLSDQQDGLIRLKSLALAHSRPVGGRKIPTIRLHR
jgi:hypothetical protein